MPERSSFDYAIVQVVPHVERDERLNAGVILFCRTLSFLDARIELDHQRLLALAPDADRVEIETHLAAIPRICAGGKAAGPIGQLTQAERFHWLVAPRSTVVQTSAVHSGLSRDPGAALEHLVATMVRLPGAAAQPNTDAYERSAQTADAVLSNLRRALVTLPATEGDERFAEAVAALDRALGRGPTSGRATHEEEGVILIGRQRYAEALAALRRARSAGRRTADARQDIAQALRTLAQEGNEGESADAQR